MAVVILLVAGGIGYAVGNGGGAGNTHTWEGEQASGIRASVIREGDKGEVRLANVSQLPEGKVLEAWVKREGKVEAVPRSSRPIRRARPRPRSTT